jgi:AcrR family transcriptional regulator
MSPRFAVEEQQEVRRKQLIKATFEEVAEKGFHEVTLEDIAVRAGVSKGVLLYYFDSKEDLFHAAFARTIMSLGERLRAAISGARSAEDKLRAFLDTVFVGPQANRRFYQVFIDCLSLGTRQERFEKLNAGFYHNCVKMDADIVQQGIREGVFRRDADPAVLRAIFEGLMLQWLFDEKGSYESYRQRTERALLSYLRT